MKKPKHGLTESPWSSAGAGMKHRQAREAAAAKLLKDSPQIVDKYTVTSNIFLALTASGIDQEGITRANRLLLKIFMRGASYGGPQGHDALYYVPATDFSQAFITDRPKRATGRSGKRTDGLDRTVIWNIYYGWLNSVFHL